MGPAHERRIAGGAEAAGFEVFVTPDRNIRYQQNLAGRRIALVVLRKAQWPYVRNHLSEIAEVVNAATPGSYVEVQIRERRGKGQNEEEPPHVT